MARQGFLADQLLQIGSGDGLDQPWPHGARPCERDNPAEIMHPGPDQLSDRRQVLTAHTPDRPILVDRMQLVDMGSAQARRATFRKEGPANAVPEPRSHIRTRRLADMDRSAGQKCDGFQSRCESSMLAFQHHPGIGRMWVGRGHGYKDGIRHGIRCWDATVRACQKGWPEPFGEKRLAHLTRARHGRELGFLR